jgi:ABC-type branched-subunit amino acid transport system ATPase component
MSIIELSNVSKSFDGIKAVDNVSIGFDKSKITALIGPNGAGKTTVFNLISGFLRPDKGTILLGGRNIATDRPWRIASKGIGRLFQDVRVFDRMTVAQNVLAAFHHQSGENIWRAILTRRAIARQESDLGLETLRFLEFVGLAQKANDLAESLSYGQQKLLAIARLLAAGAQVFLLDEPTAGINPGMVSNILSVIKSLTVQGKTVIVIEHNMNVILEIAHWIYFMDEGQVISFGLPRDVLGDPEIRRAYMGL